MTEIYALQTIINIHKAPGLYPAPLNLDLMLTFHFGFDDFSNRLPQAPFPYRRTKYPKGRRHCGIVPCAFSGQSPHENGGT